ncbi:MAG: HDIG domain-containing protein [Thermoguttaceae bacterium]|nr:HDIG domain-containing protein [Thermoguttaceae bacterium]
MRLPEERSERNDGRNAERRDAKPNGGERSAALDANADGRNRYRRRRFKERSADAASGERRDERDGNKSETGKKDRFERGNRPSGNRRPFERGGRDGRGEKNGGNRDRFGQDFGASAARFAQIDEERLLEKLKEKTPAAALVLEARSVDWAAVEEIFAEWVEPMKASPQNSDHHAEGDVWTHTKMVCETLIGLPEWGTLTATRRALTFLAALWHDVGKPRCVRYRNGRVTTPKHGPKGAGIARRLLIEKCGYDGDADLIEFREQICCLVENHTKPRCFRDFYCKNEELERVASRTSCDWLALISEADVKGRLGVSPGSRLAKIEFFRRFARRRRAFDGGASE